METSLSTSSPPELLATPTAIPAPPASIILPTFLPNDDESTASPGTQSGFAILRGHLSCHADAHPIFAAADLGATDELVESFREDIARLPQEHVLNVITSLQACIDGCQLDAELSCARLRLLQDICSFSGLLPEVYWINDVSRGRRIAGGGEATVYKAQHRGSVVVVREFHPPEHDGWDEPEGQSVFKLDIREVIAHWQLRHPNVVALLGIHQFGEEESGPPSMVLQFAEHASARQYLKAHPEPQHYLRVVEGLLDGICYLHSRTPPVIHGDLHDRNILITSAGDALVCDFGLSRIRHEVTRTHTTLRQGGRLRFVAPELSAGPSKFRINEVSDVYSLAMTFYALGTGLAPLHEIGSDFAASRAAEAGTRPSKFQSLTTASRSTSSSNTEKEDDDVVVLCLGGMTESENEQLWTLMTKMWGHEPSSRPSVSIVRKELASNGLIPMSPSPPLDPDPTPPLSPVPSFASAPNTTSSSTTSSSTPSADIVSKPEPESSVAIRKKPTSATEALKWTIPPHVLIVEDDAVSRRLVSKFLQVSGCEIEVAGDGLGAVSKMELEKYDLVLMDIVMPRLDGVSATNLIRRFDPRTPIISMTSKSKLSEILSYYSSGMNDVLPKPFTRDNLITMLEKHLMHLKGIHGDNAKNASPSATKREANGNSPTFTPANAAPAGSSISLKPPLLPASPPVHRNDSAESVSSTDTVVASPIFGPNKTDAGAHADPHDGFMAEDVKSNASSLLIGMKATNKRPMIPSLAVSGSSHIYRGKRRLDDVNSEAGHAAIEECPRDLEPSRKRQKLITHK